MKCANCGAKLKVGSVYCYVCGKEAQIVSDYNLLEDDFLREVLKEKEEKAAREKAKERVEKEKKEKSNPRPHANPPVKKGNRRVKKRIIFAVVSMILLVVLIAAIILLVNHGRENSYDYQMEQAVLYKEEGNYREAETYVKRAIELEDSLTAELFLSDIYLLRGEEKKALELLQQLCRENKDQVEIYQRLIQIYDKQKDYDSIRALSEQTDDQEIQELFSDYIPEIPEFTRGEGVYTEELSVEIMAETDCEVYYTLDGSDPKQGQKYQAPVEIKPGQNIQIRAVACNSYGIYGEEAEGTFQVELQKPEMPRVTPGGGNFIAPQNISVAVPEGCRVYYTWDGTDPTSSSKEYTQPIAMPEGNNILSLILVDQYGMRSDVFRCNYIYLP
ncbi:MAG: hypothetical protein HFI70_09925 [Lachnospiraceae bacterium]|nr:hypothetical protein [Lachnospiraceae bacterium]